MREEPDRTVRLFFVVVCRTQLAFYWPPDLATTAIRQLHALPLSRYPHQPFLDRIWDLWETLTPYEACYVALAEAVGVPLVTLDEALTNASGPRCRFEIIQ
ncbi:MAG: type II toxin-antitoxin system VapC family toxin [Acidimicrobiia bacterium]